MSDPVDRFRRRKKRRPALTEVPSDEAVQEHLDTRSRGADLLEPISATPEEGRALLAELEAELSDQEIKRLLSSCGNAALAAVVRPFGLGAILFRGFDASRRDALLQQRQNAELDYNPKAYHGGNAAYNDARQAFREQAENGTLRDVYNPDRDLSGTVTAVSPDGTARSRVRFDTEHIVSAKEVHQEVAGSRLARMAMDEQQRADLANREENLGAAHQSLNRSKGKDDLKDWMDKPSSHDKDVANAEAYKLDREAALQADAVARGVIGGEIRMAQLRFAAESTMTATKEGIGMGVQQALGLVLIEFISAAFDEVRALWSQGREQSGLLEELRLRLGRITSRIADKRAQIWSAFKLGSLAGFLGSLATIVINQVVRKVKNLGRMVREGANSVVQAGALVLSPPEGMDKTLALHEASKLLVAGAAIAGGIVLEEAILTSLQSTGVGVALGVLLQPLALVLAGLVAGIGTALAAYALDQADILGVKSEDRHQQLMAGLALRLEATSS